jgi:hypothetical protein
MIFLPLLIELIILKVFLKAIQDYRKYNENQNAVNVGFIK